MLRSHRTISNFFNPFIDASRFDVCDHNCTSAWESPNERPCWSWGVYLIERCDIELKRWSSVVEERARRVLGEERRNVLLL
jgi:hypothetical protein